jgi:CDP-4-dehydro-6-deoxyglucose reductase
MSFQIRIEPSGHSFSIEPGETVLDGALKHGFALPYSCRGGGCGACKGKILSGQVDYGTGLPPALSEEERDQGLALFCLAEPTSDLVIESKEVGGYPELTPQIYPCKVQKKELLSQDVVRLYLKLPGDERMPFLAGQYIDILLKDGRHRSFSLANAPHDDAYLELHIRHVEGGDFTGYVMDELKEGDVLRIEGPHGHFHLNENSQKPLILMAGGTGFAPIKGVLEHALAEKLTQPIHLYWGARSKRDLYLLNLAQQWAANHNNVHFIPVLSDPDHDDAWDGRTGYVHDAVLEDFPDGFVDYEVYACGPPGLVNAGHAAFIARGLPADCYYSDAFEFQTPGAKAE